MSGGHPTTENQTFYRVEKELTPGQCECPACLHWTIVYDGKDEPIGISTSWQGEDGKEMAEDICDLMNMAYDAGQESRQETITGLCDRLDKINGFSRPRPAKDPYKMLREIEELSAGFMKVPV